MQVGEKVGIQYRKQYFAALMNQDVEWHDARNPNALSTAVASECQEISEAIGEKAAGAIFAISLMAFGILIGLILGWQLSLINFATIPLVFFTGYIYIISVQNINEETTKSYS